MSKSLLTAGGALLLFAATACTSHYKLASTTHTRIVVDQRYDAHPDQAAANFLAPYKQKVDSIMGPVVGTVAHDMDVTRPESDLSNLLSDILVWASKDYNEHPVFGVYNMGGIRAALSKGNVTYGDVLDVAPFENKIAFTTLSGTDVLALFSQMAAVGGEGVSHAVRMVITEDGKLVSATISGQPVEAQKDYRIATIDYLLGGTDKMEAFKRGRNVNSPQDKSNNSRFIIMDYFKDVTKQGKEVDAQIEGRITVQK
jgi:2',3'-cyclic-nucleotide 2'-phosphodiesterase (5'-nucleotidase family)